MKRLSILLVGLLSAVLVFSVVGLADEADYALAEINFDEVLDLSVSNSTLESLDIAQNDDTGVDVALADMIGDESGVVDFIGQFDVDIVALTSFEVGVSYYAKNNDNNTEEASGLILLNSEDGSAADEASLDFYDNDANWNFGDDSGTKPTLANIKEVTGDYSSSDGPNNLPGGESKPYSINVDLSKLTEEYTNEDELDIQVTFWAYDAST